MTKPAVLALLFAASLAASTAGCGDDSPTAPSTTTPTGPQTEAFSGFLPLQGSSFYSFSVAAGGTAQITLASLMAGSTGPGSTAIVELGLGNPVGTGCSLVSTVNTAPALTSQIATAVVPDVYCVNIRDTGKMTVPLNFTIRIVHP